MLLWIIAGGLGLWVFAESVYALSLIAGGVIALAIGLVVGIKALIKR